MFPYFSPSLTSFSPEEANQTGESCFAAKIDRHSAVKVKGSGLLLVFSLSHISTLWSTVWCPATPSKRGESVTTHFDHSNSLLSCLQNPHWDPDQIKYQMNEHDLF